MRTLIATLRAWNGKSKHAPKRLPTTTRLSGESLAFETLERRALLSADAASNAANAAAMTAAATSADMGTVSTSTNGGVQTGANGSITSSGVESVANGNVSNGTGTNGQFGIQQGVNATPNGDVTGTGVNTSFGSQNPGDAGIGAPGTTFNPGVGLDTRPGDENPGDAGFGAPGTTFNPTGIPLSQAGPGGNGSAAANTAATDAVFAHVDTAAYDPALVQYEIENATLHPVR